MIKSTGCITIDSPHLKLWETFPMDNGAVKHLRYVPKQRLAAYESAWREWCKKYPRNQWHPMIEEWAEEKKRLEK